MKFTPLVKGLITGILIVIISLLVFYKKTGSNYAPYVIYGIYAAGIIWTLLDYARYPGSTRKFGDIFTQGFRCFIIVTLVYVIYTAIFGYTHPELAVESGNYYKEALVQEKQKTPAEIETIVAEYKKNYVVRNISQAAFATMIIGVIFTLAGTGLVLMRRT